MGRKKKQNHINYTGGFAGIPRLIMKSSDYKNLSGGAIKLLIEFAYQYNGSNNGDLTAAYSILQKHGFNSKQAISRAIKELQNANMVICTRQGKFLNPSGYCSLYALTWQPIHECNNKLEVAPTASPPRKFSLEEFRKPRPETGLDSSLKRVRQQERDEKGKYVSAPKRGRLTAVT